MTDPDIPLANAVPIPPPINPAYDAASAPGSYQNERQSQIDLSYSHSDGLDESKVMGTLMEQGYTRGLAEAMIRSKQTFPLRIWVVDNSGSMQHVDGHRIVQKDHQLKLVQCTRWTEMQQTVEYHALMSAQLQSPTVFR